MQYLKGDLMGVASTSGTTVRLRSSFGHHCLLWSCYNMTMLHKQVVADTLHLKNSKLSQTSDTITCKEQGQVTATGHIVGHIVIYVIHVTLDRQGLRLCRPWANIH